MTDWMQALPMMDPAELRPVFDPLAGLEVDAARELVEDRKHVRRSDKRILLDGRRLQNCILHIGTLPQCGQAYHMVTSKKYSLFHVVEAVLHLASPERIEHLVIATLRFSRDNLERLLALLDTGQIGTVDFLFSVFHKSLEKEICGRLTAELPRRKQRCVACLTHAKVLLLKLSDGRCFVCESSANLRSCSSIEQLMLTQDQELFDFHFHWIDELMRAKT